MDQRISLLTLGVSDLPRAVAFYESLGWTVGNDWRAQDVAFFQGVGMVFGLWARDELAADSGTSVQAPGSVTLALNLGSPAEVDSVLAEAAAAGAHIHRSGAATEWGGYSGVFHDPDGHPWEVAHNPFWRIGADGSTNLQ
ncbi:MAG: Lactoylglutathione lyase [Thermoleophilia bacterium]|nr:Lactoylglutathione lyase [Thermoleophilia bacterium]